MRKAAVLEEMGGLVSHTRRHVSVVSLKCLRICSSVEANAFANADSVLSSLLKVSIAMLIFVVILTFELAVRLTVTSRLFDNTMLSGEFVFITSWIISSIDFSVLIFILSICQAGDRLFLFQLHVFCPQAFLIFRRALFRANLMRGHNPPWKVCLEQRFSLLDAESERPQF